ncbi:MAG: hypothetical protein C0467_26825 [Planctomycetaceae bacterium]|nr:hypothetical protein [Planctomycetaceae bacterium]
MVLRVLAALLMFVGAVGCGPNVQPTNSEQRKDQPNSKPTGPKESPPKADPLKGTPSNAIAAPAAMGKAVPTKLYAAGLIATADLPPGVDVRGEASFQMHLRFRKDFLLYIKPTATPYAEVLAAEKKRMAKFVAEDVDGFVTGDDIACTMHRQVKINGVEYVMSCSSYDGNDVLLAYAVARSVRQTPEDLAAAKRSAEAWKKLAEDDKHGLHPALGEVMVRLDDKPSDAAFAAIKDIAYIKRLQMNAAGTVTPEGLKVALGPNVFDFWAMGDWFTDSFAKSLTGNATLQMLMVESKTLGDEGGKQLTGLVNVWYAHLITPNLTDQSASVFLPTLTRVEVLSLNCPKLTNTFVPALAKLDRLEDLNLSSTGITDDAIADLAKIPGLRSVTVRMTKMTAEGVKKLRAAKKDLRVYSDFDK